MACWARIVTYFTGTILFLMFPTSECTKSMWQSVTIVWQAACHTFCSGIRSQSNQNRIQSARWVSIVLTSVSQLSFRSFLTAGWTKTDVTIVWQAACHTLVTARFSILNNSDRVQMQEISMGGSGGSPRHRNPAVEAWFIFLSSFWPILGSRG